MENYKIDRQVLTLKNMLAIISAISNSLLLFIHRNSKGEIVVMNSGVIQQLRTSEELYDFPANEVVGVDTSSGRLNEEQLFLLREALSGKDPVIITSHYNLLKGFIDSEKEAVYPGRAADSGMFRFIRA